MDSIGGNLSRIKVKNQFAIKEAVYKFGPISRNEIADRLGLTLPTITTNVSQMMKRGLLKEVESSRGTRTLGRRTMLIDINEDYGLYMGLEIRGTVRRAVVVDARGKVKATADDNSPSRQYDDAMASAVNLSKVLLEKLQATFDDIRTIGIAIPGIVDREKKMLVIHPGYKWAQKNIGEDFARLSGYRGMIQVENNTIARAYAMTMFSGESLEGADTLAYMFISAGIGCPLLSNVRSHFGLVTGVGEVGHMIMDPEGPLCACGNRGCLEAFSSEGALASRAAEAAGDGSSAFLARRLAEQGALGIMDLVEGKRAGDAPSAQILDRGIEYLGLAIANIDNFVRPECVVVEGRAFDDEANRSLLLDVIHRNLYRETFSDYRLCFKTSDDYSGARGAAATAIKADLECLIE